VEIEVVDTGRGIPDEELDKIFLRFYQVENKEQVVHPGTGIGLALAKELVELHHGFIRVESKQGIGSAFKVWLPLEKKCFEQNEVVDFIGTEVMDEIISHEFVQLNISSNVSLVSEKEENMYQNLPRILIVDDNADMRLLLKENLRHAFRIEEAKDGEEAIIIAKETQPELIISDVMMPAMYGFELCENLKNDIETSHIPLILLTARITLDQRIKGIDTGADAYITKPFSLEFLEIRIRKLIENRKKLRDRYLKNEILKPNELAVTSLDEVFLQKVKNVLEQHIAGVANMPGAVSHTSTYALTNSTLPYLRNIAGRGLAAATAADAALAKGVNTHAGRMRHEPVAHALNLPFTPYNQL
jgi:CheY-like chemotaxis protein